MFIEMDLTTVPPGVTLRAPDDFTAFRIVLIPADHGYVSVDELKRLAGERAHDPAWAEKLEAMLSFAAARGWMREDGAVRAHVEPAP